MALFHLKIVFVDVGVELEFLDLDVNLFLAGLFLFLGLGVLKFAEIHDLANWRRGGRGHFHQIQSGRVGALRSLEERHDPQSFVVFVKKAHLLADQVPVIRKYYACDGGTLLLGSGTESPRQTRLQQHSLQPEKY